MKIKYLLNIIVDLFGILSLIILYRKLIQDIMGALNVIINVAVEK